MAKLAGRNPAFEAAEGSPQGAAFLSALTLFLGDELWWKLLEETGETGAVFVIGGRIGETAVRGILVESPVRQQDDAWVHRWGLRVALPGHGVVLQSELLAHRWDPCLHAHLTCEADHPGVSTAGSRPEQERGDRKIGCQEDQFRITVLPDRAARRDVCGVPVDRIETLLERFAAREHEGTFEVGMLRPVSDDLVELGLIHGNFPLSD